MNPRDKENREMSPPAASLSGLAGEAGRRWLCFEAALALTLLPAWLGLSWLPALMNWPRFFELAWTWQILATLPGGLTRPGSGNGPLLPDAAGVLAIAFWIAAGLAAAIGLRQLRFRLYLALCLPLVFAAGTLAWLALRALGFAPFAGV